MKDKKAKENPPANYNYEAQASEVSGIHVQTTRPVHRPCQSYWMHRWGESRSGSLRLMGTPPIGWMVGLEKKMMNHDHEEEGRR
jgi:hypothetical protein